MQPHTTAPINNNHYLPGASENDPKLPNIKSPIKSSFLKRKNIKTSYNNENLEPSQPKPDSSAEINPPNNPIENKAYPITPNKSKSDLSAADPVVASREHHIVSSKPVESPFTAFCRGLNLSPGPLFMSSPGVLGKNPLFFGSNEVGNFISPSPMNLHLGAENGTSSPLFPRKHITKLDFSNRFIMFKSHRDEISIEPEESNDKYGGASYDNSLAFDENLQNSPKFNFPMKKSIYSSTNLVPTQTRTNDIYSQSPTRGPMHKNDHDDKEGMHPNAQGEKANDEGTDGDNSQSMQNIVFDTLKTPSPNRRVTLDSINSFPGKEGQQKATQSAESLLMQRTMSFGPGVNQTNSEFNTANSSARSSLAKIKPQEEEGDYEEDSINGTKNHSSNKKKICCNCKKSRCLKLYCDCFARGKACSKDCNCQSCLNNESNAEERRTAMLSTLERNPIAFKPKVNLTDTPEKVEIKENVRVRHIKGCNCKKSGCLKKYCECFQAGAKCTEVCKCENCKNMDPFTQMRKAQLYGGYSNVGYDSGEKSNMKMESPLSDTRGPPIKANARSFPSLEQEEEEEENSLDDESDDGEEEDVKKYLRPRKQLFSSAMKSPQSRHNMLEKSPVGFKLKEEEFGEQTDDKNDNDKFRSSNKQKDKKRKGSALLSTQLKTPTSYSESQKKIFDYTPSPEKQSLSGGRTRRHVRPFSHINPDEYEIGK